MKQFKDLQPGDKIYYWDKGQVHEQIVHQANWETETRERVSGYMSALITESWKVFHLIAGKNNRTDFKLRYADCSQLHFGWMPRFSCYEALEAWLKSNQSRISYQVKRLEKKLNRMKRSLSQYNDALDNEY